MKIKGEKYQIMYNAMRGLVEHYGIDTIKQVYIDKSEAQLLWALWNYAEQNARYDDNHPFFVNRNWIRTSPYVPSFNIYSDGVNDDHIFTALKKIGKELGII